MLQRLLYTLFYGNIWIASGAAATAWQTTVVLQLEPNPTLYVFVFLATLFTYNLDRYTERLAFADSYQTRHRWLHEHRRELAIFTILPGIAWVALSFRLSTNVVLWLVHLGVVSVAYSLPLWKKANGERFVLRKVGLLKPVFVAYVWAVVGVILPAVDAGYPLNGRLYAELISRFVFVLALCMPFDLRDEPIDRSHGMRTLPVLLGRKPTEYLAYLLLVLQLAMLVPFLPLGSSVLLTISLLYAAFATRYAISSGHDLAFSAGVDGALVLQAVLLALGS
jgi:4-hydroxybenzoate polyprenyltransferase